MFAYLINESRLFWRIVTFDYCALKYFYLLTDQFLVDNYLWRFYGKTPTNHVMATFL